MEAKAKAGEDDLSMEEILQSIRKIIAEDGDEAPTNGAAHAAPAITSDVLELTDMVEEQPAETAKASAANSQDAVNDILSTIDQVVVPETPAPKPAAPVAVAPAASVNDQAYIDSLLSAEAATATVAAFKKAHPPEQPIITTPSAHFRGGNTVEDLVMESLKPMLKQWLDLNLPNIVERIVEREIKKLTD